MPKADSNAEVDPHFPLSFENNALTPLPLHQYCCMSKQCIASLTFFLVSVAFMTMANHWYSVLSHCELITADQTQQTALLSDHEVALHKHGCVFRLGGRPSHDVTSWFQFWPVRQEFQAPNSKSTNFSANAAFSVWGLVPIIVSCYKKNLFQQSVMSLHFTRRLR